MKGFSGPKTRAVTLAHDGDEIVITMRALPWGFSSLVDEAMPAPDKADKADEVARGKWATRRVMVFLAKSIEGIEAVAPSGSAGAEAWAAYADAVEAELVAANLTEGDVQILLDTLTSLNKGGPNLPKA